MLLLDDASSLLPRRRHRRLRRVIAHAAHTPLLAVAAYLLAAHVALPAAWSQLAQWPQDNPLISCNGQRIPSDPVNLVVIATEKQLSTALAAGGWHGADATTFTSGIQMAACVLLDRPYPQAPLSKLFLLGRAQDLAFQQPVGESPRQRHHVRFWRAAATPDGRSIWVGAATLDTGIGVSSFTGQLTHRIDPDLDAERDVVAASLAAGGARHSGWVKGVGPGTRRNGTGDLYFTDGRAAVCILGDAVAPAWDSAATLATTLGLPASR